MTEQLQASISVANNSNVDERSRKGIYGWFTLDNDDVPLLFRTDGNYCSTRMVEVSALHKYLRFLKKDIYKYIKIKSICVTPAEASLLNEINSCHSNLYGPNTFTVADLIIKVSDAEEFYNFLANCYSKLLCGIMHHGTRFGFIPVPYVTRENQKYMPLFRLGRRTNNLIPLWDNLERWDLCYLKFCCQVHGIDDQIFVQDACSAISLNDMRDNFLPEATFDEHWPINPLNRQLLLRTDQAAIGEWAN